MKLLRKKFIKRREIGAYSGVQVYVDLQKERERGFHDILRLNAGGLSMDEWVSRWSARRQLRQKNPDSGLRL